MSNIRYKESLLVLNLMLNTFSIFGILFLFSLMLEYDFLKSYSGDYKIIYDLFFYVALNIVIYFISFLYLKFMFGDKVRSSIFFNLKVIVYFLLIFYYLVIPIRLLFFNSFNDIEGLRFGLGFFTPLWLLCPLLVFNPNINERRSFIFYCMVESVFYLLMKYIFFPKINDLVFFRTFLYLFSTFFMFFILNRLRVSMNCPNIIFIPVSFVMSLFGIVFIISYYLMI